jgi:pyridoxal/pyridoxine/pyridoxamine kinase
LAFTCTLAQLLTVSAFPIFQAPPLLVVQNISAPLVTHEMERFRLFVLVNQPPAGLNTGVATVFAARLLDEPDDAATLEALDEAVDEVIAEEDAVDVDAATLEALDEAVDEPLFKPAAQDARNRMNNGKLMAIAFRVI